VVADVVEMAQASRQLFGIRPPGQRFQIKRLDGFARGARARQEKPEHRSRMGLDRLGYQWAVHHVEGLRDRAHHVADRGRGVDTKRMLDHLADLIIGLRV